MLSRSATMFRLCAFALSLPLLLHGASAVAVAPKSLDIYVLDVEGGTATLLITPARETVLIDGGWNTPDHRDSKRILAVLKANGLDHLDFVIVSHYHSDHLGGIVELAQQIPVTRFLDRGLMGSPEPYVSDDLYAEYLKVAGSRRRAAKPGEKILLKAEPHEPSPSLRVLSAAGKTIQNPAGTPNVECAASHAGPIDEGENANSVGILLEFGSFRYLDAADLTWPKEAQLVCPFNQIGRVNVYQVDHHGKDTSNNPVLLASIHADAAVMNNGATKGGDASVVAELRKVLSSADVYQVHRNLKTGAAGNVAESNIANPDTLDGAFGFQIHVDASSKSYEVINQRTGAARKYSSVRRSEEPPTRENVH